ncbi:MAG: peptidoglycan binding protein CsiV [Kangiella sp.]|nr:peptidoglycan binding protein CsiV [Kangiella sp.]
MSKFNYSRSHLKAALFGLLLLPLLAHGEEEPRWYQVEVIIFSQNSPAYHKSEIWPIDFTLPDLEKSRELVKPKRGDQRQPAPLLPEPFSLADKASLQLGETAARIKRAGDVELVLHLGWVQPGLEQSKSVPVHIYEGMLEQPAASGKAGEPLPKLDGTLRLSLARYLHLESDLVWREPLPPSLSDFAQEIVPMENADSAATMDAETLPEVVQEAPAPNYQVFRMQQSSRMRSDEIHYQDHPLFGVIAVVTRYQPAVTGAQ